MVGVKIDASSHAIGQAFGLFENLFEHKVGVSALFNLSEIDINSFDFRTELPVVDIHHLQFLTTSDNSNVAIFQIHHFISILNNRTGI